MVIGVLNLPIIYFSLSWWNTLHQGAGASLTGFARMARTMLGGMLVMALAFWTYANAVILARVRCLHAGARRAPFGVLRRKRHEPGTYLLAGVCVWSSLGHLLRAHGGRSTQAAPAHPGCATHIASGGPATPATGSNSHNDW